MTKQGRQKQGYTHLVQDGDEIGVIKFLTGLRDDFLQDGGHLTDVVCRPDKIGSTQVQPRVLQAAIQRYSDMAVPDWSPTSVIVAQFIFFIRFRGVSSMDAIPPDC
jgi:hypothetical protein